MTEPSAAQWIRYWLLTARDEAIMDRGRNELSVSVNVFKMASGDPCLTARQQLLKIWERKYPRNRMRWDGQPIPILFAPFVFRYPYQRQSRSGRWPSQVIPLWIPGQIDPDGNWGLPMEDPSTGQRPKPWIVRDYLEPLTEASILTIGSVDEVDHRLMEGKWSSFLGDWPDYVTSAETILPAEWAERLEEFQYQGPKTVTNAGNAQGIVLWDDSNRGTLSGIISVYEHLLEHPDQISPLLRHYTKMERTPHHELLPSAWAHHEIHHHLGHINAERQRTLNTAQRNALVHAFALDSGTLMALNGPPGTGKTTWIHGFWASAWTRAAIAGDDLPPMTVVASTNNQAVGNVLDSLNRDIVAERWLPNIPAQFGLLIKTEDDERMPEGTWRASWNGGSFDSPFSAWMTATFLNQAEAEYRRHVNEVLGRGENSEQDSFADVVERWHQYLRQLFDKYEAQGELWSRYEQFTKIFPEGFDASITPVAERYQQSLASQEQWQQSRRDWNALRARIRPWDRPALWFNHSRWVNEWQALAQRHRWSFEGPWIETDIERWLQQQEARSQSEVDERRQSYDDLVRDWRVLQDVTDQLTAVMDGQSPEHWSRWADTQWRNPMFTAALHYWEGRWLLATRQQLTAQSLNRSDPEEDHRAWWGTMAMLAPCFVTTLHSGPRQFTRWNVATKRNDPLTQLIDWLLLDESGQISVHLPGGLMAIAKRAVIIGDTQQLQPISSISEGVDQGNARVTNLATTTAEYHQWRTNHVWAGSGQETVISSAMGRAQQRSVWSEAIDQDDLPGMTLTEHHRCLTPIIAFCNELVYHNRLEPKRHHYHRTPHPWPTWGYAPIWGHAEREGSSWTNPTEAHSIAQWLANESAAIEAHYEQSVAMSVAIITPFKAQGQAIRQALTDVRLIADDEQNNWKVGTIHGIQGAERPLVIFSPVYTTGTPVSSFFFDRSTEMLNVAVSRARDSFWIFGDTSIFDSRSNQPSGLLARYLRTYAEEIPIIPQRTDAYPLWMRLDTVDTHREWLAQQFKQAQQQIVIISPFLSSRAIRADQLNDRIVQARQRGVSVKIYHDQQWAQDSRHHQQSTEAIQLLKQAGAEVVELPQIHAKIVIVDNDVVAEGSFNWLSAERLQFEHMRWDTTLVYRDPALIRPWISQIAKRVKALERSAKAL